MFISFYITFQFFLHSFVLVLTINICCQKRKVKKYKDSKELVKEPTPTFDKKSTAALVTKASAIVVQHKNPQTLQPTNDKPMLSEEKLFSEIPTMETEYVGLTFEPDTVDPQEGAVQVDPLTPQQLRDKLAEYMHKMQAKENGKEGDSKQDEGEESGEIANNMPTTNEINTRDESKNKTITKEEIASKATQKSTVEEKRFLLEPQLKDAKAVPATVGTKKSSDKSEAKNEWLTKATEKSATPVKSQSTQITIDKK